MESPLGGHDAIAPPRQSLVDALAQVLGDPLAVQIESLHHHAHMAGGIGTGSIPAGKALYMPGLGEVLENDLLKIPDSGGPSPVAQGLAADGVHLLRG